MSFVEYLDQDTLYTILNDDDVKATISAASVDCCSSSLIFVEVPVADGTTTTAATPDGSTTAGTGDGEDGGLNFAYILAIVGAVVGLLVIVIIIIVCIVIK